MVPAAEVGLARLQDVELRFRLEVGDQLLGVGGLGGVHGLRQHLERDVLDPGVVLRDAAVLLGEVGHESQRARGLELVVPHGGPDAAQVAFAGSPGVGRVQVETGHRVGQTELRILLHEVGHLVAGQVGGDQVRLGLADLEQVGAEVGHVGGHQLVADHRAAVGGEETLGLARQVVAEEVVGRQAEDLLALDQALTHQRLAGGIHHHRDRDVDVEGVAVAVLAAQRVGARADAHEQLLVARGHLRDGQRRAGVDLAHQHRDVVALDHALRLGGGRLRVDRVFAHHIERAAHHAAGGVDLLGRHLDALGGVLAQRAEEARHGREVADLDRARLRAHPGGHAQRGRAGHEGAGLEQFATLVRRRREVYLVVLGFHDLVSSRFGYGLECKADDRKSASLWKILFSEMGYSYFL